MKIRYQGPLGAVEIAATGQIARRGEPTDVPADVAKALLRQEDTWARVTTTKKAKTQKAKTQTSSKQGDDS